jgi:hypothetical protein
LVANNRNELKVILLRKEMRWNNIRLLIESTERIENLTLYRGRSSSFPRNHLLMLPFHCHLTWTTTFASTCVTLDLDSECPHQQDESYTIPDSFCQTS